MNRRSFIATLAAGIAGLFVPLPKPESEFVLCDDIDWDSVPMTHGIKHSELEWGAGYWHINTDHDSHYWHVITIGELRA